LAPHRASVSQGRDERKPNSGRAIRQIQQDVTIMSFRKIVPPGPLWRRLPTRLHALMPIEAAIFLRRPIPLIAPRLEVGLGAV
jgi:hypothetical protein